MYAHNYMLHSTIYIYIYNMVLEKLRARPINKGKRLAVVLYELSIQSEFSFHPVKSST